MATPPPSYEDDLAALEAALTAALFAGFGAVTAAMVAELTRLIVFLEAQQDYGVAVAWPTELGRFFDRWVPRALDAIPADVQARITDGVRRAYDLAAGVSLAGRPEDAVPPVPGQDVAGIVEDQVRAVDAVRQPAMLTGPDAAHAVAGAVQRVETRTKTAITWELNRAAAQAVTDSAAARGWRVIWLAERDACVICLRLQGEHIAPGDQFPHYLTFGPKRPPAPWQGVLFGPPRHPNCRCTLQAVDPRDVAGTVEALTREARRSIARGFKRPSESERVRLRAADRLVRRGARLPKTVEEYARRAIRAGRFPGHQPAIRD